MNVFKTLTNSNWNNLTRGNYEKLTYKKAPYFQTIDGKVKHFAICPVCNNPTRIINYYEKSNSGVKLHARHYKKLVQGISEYSQKNYDECILSNPRSFNSETKDPSNDKKKNEIIELIKTHSDTVKCCIQQITGINISKNLFNEIMTKFIKEEGYYFLHVNKFNLPYSVLYLSDNNSINKQFINNPQLMQAINYSKAYCLSEQGQIESKIDDRYQQRSSIEMYFTGYKPSSSLTTGSMKMVISEVIDKMTDVIYSKRIDIDLGYFIRKIAK